MHRHINLSPINQEDGNSHYSRSVDLLGIQEQNTQQIFNHGLGKQLQNLYGK